MKIYVRFAGTMREIAGRQNLEVELDSGGSLLDLFSKLTPILPAIFEEQIINPICNAQTSITILMVNQKHIHNAHSLNDPIEDGDRVVFVPPMEGG